MVTTPPERGGDQKLQTAGDLNTRGNEVIHMSTVHVRVEMVEVASPDGTAVQGYRAYAADIGLSAEGTSLDDCITTIKSAVGAYLGKPANLNWMRAEFRLSAE